MICGWRGWKCSWQGGKGLGRGSVSRRGMAGRALSPGAHCLSNHSHNDFRVWCRSRIHQDAAELSAEDKSVFALYLHLAQASSKGHWWPLDESSLLEPSCSHSDCLAISKSLHLSVTQLNGCCRAHFPALCYLSGDIICKAHGALW